MKFTECLIYTDFRKLNFFGFLVIYEFLYEHFRPLFGHQHLSSSDNFLPIWTTPLSVGRNRSHGGRREGPDEPFWNVTIRLETIFFKHLSQQNNV